MGRRRVFPQSNRRKATRTSHTPAPDSTATVAPFRAWRGSQLLVAGGPIRVTIEWRRLSADSSGEEVDASQARGHPHSRISEDCA